MTLDKNFPKSPLPAEFGKDFAKNNLWDTRRFYLAYQQKLHAVRGELSWTQKRMAIFLCQKSN